ncbi:ribokinase [Microbacterium sp. A82]|uniref:ribokinase n=1 Tax=Microbacterium sp. A82 TaxID=3450452 RepID=UPI003F41A44C
MNHVNDQVPVLVVGSANRDYLVRVSELPSPGETVLAQQMSNTCGGKGANQAVAASRLGANVSFVGCVGDDPDGALLLRELLAEGVDVSDMTMLHDAETGRAFVWVDDHGENSIAVVPGANYHLTPAKVERVVQRARAGSILVIQAEIPAIAISAAVRASDTTRVVLNLAPVIALPDDVLERADPFVLNEAEASALTGIEVRSPDDALRAARAIRPVPRSTVITIGAGGAVWVKESRSGIVPVTEQVSVVDTTGAGDAFVGALAASLARGARLSSAVEHGVRSGSYAVRRPGAQASYARESDLAASATDGDGGRI